MLWALPAQAEAQRIDAPGRLCSDGSFGHVQCIRAAHFVFDTCQAVEGAARRHFIDPGFFARLIWQESRFDPNAVSPANARGIAQFIDSTAKLRGLRDSYNPAESLERSAQYLSFLNQEFGNLGMAAVAYNGGEARATGFLAGNGRLAGETIDYVQIITGLTAETWRDAPPDTHDFRLAKDKAFMPACIDLARNRRLSDFPAPVSRFAPWGVQVGFGKTKAQSQASFERNSASCRPLVGAETLEFVPVKNRVSGQRGFLMARIGRSTKPEAVELCRQMRRQNCVCRVYRNP